MHDNHQLIDPDPMQIAGLAFTAIAAIAPLVQMFRKTPPVEIKLQPAQEDDLTHLEQSVEFLQQQMKQLLRAVDRGSPDPDGQFYNAPTRLLATSLMLERPQFDAYTTATSNMSQAASQINIWVAGIVTRHPELARRLGSKMDVPLQEVADHLHLAIIEGRPIRDVVAELKAALESLALAIEAEINESRRN